MSIDINGRVGVVSLTDGDDKQPRLDHQGAVVVNGMSGQFYEQTLRGNAFVYSTSTAVSVVALGTTAAPNIWNPAGSGKNLVLYKLVAAAGAVGTPVVSAFQYGLLKNAGSQIGTGSPVVSLTQADPTNLLLGAGKESVMRFAPATISLTTAPTFFANAGFWLGNAAAPTTGAAFIDYINGAIILPPGNLLQIGASTATSTTFFISIYGLELAIPS